MSERLPERFTTKNLPLLVAIAHELEKGESSVHPGPLAPGLSLETQEAINLTSELRRTGYVEAREVPGDGRIMSIHVLALTERGLRTVGLWPSADANQLLLDAISQVIGATSDEEEKSKLRKVAEVVGHMGQSVVTDLAVAYGRQLAGL